MVMMTVRADLTRIQRTNLETCITVHMHQKESTEDLVRRKVRDPTDFDWLKQVRFYWREERDTVIISICDVDFEYRWGAAWGSGAGAQGHFECRVSHPVVAMRAPGSLTRCRSQPAATQPTNAATSTWA
jgi:hypothetical protein